jgi:hypothetical protein
MTSTHVTRATIAEHVGTAFASGPADKSEILASATRSQAPPPVIRRLETLPDTPIRSLRELWAHLPEVPVE